MQNTFLLTNLRTAPENDLFQYILQYNLQQFSLLWTRRKNGSRLVWRVGQDKPLKTLKLGSQCKQFIQKGNCTILGETKIGLDPEMPFPINIFRPPRLSNFSSLLHIPRLPQIFLRYTFPSHLWDLELPFHTYPTQPHPCYIVIIMPSHLGLLLHQVINLIYSYPPDAYSTCPC